MKETTLLIILIFSTGAMSRPADSTTDAPRSTEPSGSADSITEEPSSTEHSGYADDVNFNLHLIIKKLKALIDRMAPIDKYTLLERQLMRDEEPNDGRKKRKITTTPGSSPFTSEIDYFNYEDSWREPSRTALASIESSIIEFLMSALAKLIISAMPQVG